MGKNFRKRKAEEDEAGEEEETAEDRRKRLADLKAEQEQRQRKRGLDASKLLGAKFAEEGGVSHGGARDDGDTEGELKDTFYVEHVAQPSEDPHMLKYIEEKLAEKRGTKPQKAKEEKRKPDDGRLREEDLYETPDDLKCAAHKLLLCSHCFSEIDTTEAKDTADRWLTGIIEVALPTEYRINNIEATEHAKREILQKQIDKGETAALERRGIYRKPEVQEDTRISRGIVPSRFGRSTGTFKFSSAGGR